MKVNASGLSPFTLAALFAVCNLSACANRPPTIAHTHLGHAVTAVHVTPEKEGYIAVAEKRALAALDYARTAVENGRDLAAVQANAGKIAQAVNSPDDFGLKQALIQASNHISFSSTSADASANLQQFAPMFATNIAPVVERCELIELLVADIEATSSSREALLLAEEILKLVQSNSDGDDANGDGIVGSVASEYGVTQLRSELDAAVARENPPYTVVDSWFLFNLVRLPNGMWVFDKLGRGGNIEGYR